MLLREIWSQTHVKNPDLQINVKAYLESFNNGFIPLFLQDGLIDTDQPQANVKYLYELFLDYILLSFPKERILLLLNMLKDNFDISSNSYNQRVSCLKKMKQTSLKTFKSFWSSNKCLKLIVKKMPEIMKNYNHSITVFVLDYIKKLI